MDYKNHKIHILKKTFINVNYIIIFLMKKVEFQENSKANFSSSKVEPISSSLTYLGRTSRKHMDGQSTFLIWENAVQAKGRSTFFLQKPLKERERESVCVRDRRIAR